MNEQRRRACCPSPQLIKLANSLLRFRRHGYAVTAHMNVLGGGESMLVMRQWLGVFSQIVMYSRRWRQILSWRVRSRVPDYLDAVGRLAD